MPTEGPHPDLISVSGIFFRRADYDTPVWSRANTLPGRWHVPARRLSVQYWSYSPDAAWAETLRTIGVRDPADALELRSTIWAARHDVSGIADLTDPEWTGWLGIDPAELIADSRARCQAIGDLLRQRCVTGIVAPSAALPDHLNLVLFGRRTRGDWTEDASGVRKLRYPDLTVPCRIVAIGHPRADLVHEVRYAS